MTIDTIIRAFKGRPPVGDVGIGALLATFLVFEIWVFNPATHGPVVATIAAVLAAGSLAYRRVLPFPALAVNVASVALLVWLGNPSAFYQWTNLIMVFSIAVHGRPVHRWFGLVVSLVGVWSSFVRRPEQGGALALAVTLAIWVIVWLVGRLYDGRMREGELRRDRDAAQALAAVRERQFELEEERLALARDLHDLIGHTVNVVLVHAQGGRSVIDDEPEKAKDALETITATAHHAINELDRFLAVVRRQADPVAGHPAPGLDRLPGLVADFESAGVSVDLRIDGHVGDVPSGVALSAYRITQAALTNTLRHAGPASAMVRIDVESDVLSLDITDTGRGLSPIDEGGGLTGIRERVALHGGEVRISNRPSGGVQVACRLPLGAR